MILLVRTWRQLCPLCWKCVHKSLGLWVFFSSPETVNADMIQSLIHGLFSLSTDIPQVISSECCWWFQIYNFNPDLFFKLSIPISNNLLNFSTWKMNITCLKQLVVSCFPNQLFHEIPISVHGNSIISKKPRCYPYPNLSFSDSSNSWPSTTYKISLGHFLPFLHCHWHLSMDHCNSC